MDGPVLMHVVTKKGKGYAPAEQNPHIYHGVGPFDTIMNAFDNAVSLGLDDFTIKIKAGSYPEDLLFDEGQWTSFKYQPSYHHGEVP